MSFNLDALKEADSKKSDQEIAVQLYNYMNDNKGKGKNFQDFEKILRDNKMTAHLIAFEKSNDLPKHQFYYNPFTGMLDNNVKYELRISSGARNPPMDSLLKQSSTYEENFEKLNDSGMIGTSKSSETDSIKALEDQNKN